MGNLSNALEIRQKQIKTVARIAVVGVGGCGNNTINRMIEEGVAGVELIAINTDLQDLDVKSKAQKRIQIGVKLTAGQGGGAIQDVGQRAAEENIDDIREALDGMEMVFVTCGMGGATGTGAAPVVAQVAREMGALTVGVVIKPFEYEGTDRMAAALSGIERIRQYTDSLIIIENDKLYDVLDRMGYDEDEDEDDAESQLKLVDDVLYQAVVGITDLINITGNINVDFADVCTVMRNKGLAHIGVGIGRGKNRVMDAAKAAVVSPFLETKLTSATDVLMNFSGFVGMRSVKEAAAYIKEYIGSEARIIFGMGQEKSGEEKKNTPIEDRYCTVTLIATGLPEGLGPKTTIPRPKTVSSMPQRSASMAQSIPQQQTFASQLQQRGMQPAPQTVSRPVQQVAQPAAVQQQVPQQAAPRPQPAPSRQFAPLTSKVKSGNLDIPKFMRPKKAADEDDDE